MQPTALALPATLNRWSASFGKPLRGPRNTKTKRQKMATRDRWHGHRSWNIDHSNDDDGNISLLGSMSAVSTTAPLMNKSKKLFSFWSVFLVLLIAGVLFLVGFFLGYFVRESFDERANFTTGYKAYQFDKAKLEAIHENVMYFISRDPDKIKTFSR